MRGSWIKVFAGLIGAALLLFLILPLVIETYTLTLLVVYGMLGLSLGLIWGFGGILCFGQAAFFGLGAYSYAIAAINFGESTFPFLIGIFVPMLVAFLLGLMMFYGRLGSVYLGVITLVFTLILYRFMNSTAGPEYAIGSARLGGFNGIPGFQTLNIPGDPDAYLWGDQLYYVSAVLLILVYLFLHWLLKTPFGRVSIAIRENESRVELMGYDIRIRKSFLFALGGGIAGLSGVLYASWAEIVTPGLFSLGQSAEVIIWCIVGGLGTLGGPILGGMLIGLLKFYLGQQSVIDNTVFLGLVLILSVLFLPNGVLPVLQRLGSRLFGRKSRGGRRRRRGRPNEEKEEVSHG